MSARTINAILTHQGPGEVAAMLRWWERRIPGAEVLVVYGADEAQFQTIAAPQKVLVGGRDHQTSDHQRERQSYGRAFHAVAGWLEGRDFDFVNFVEYDLVPLAPDWLEELAARCEAERADMLCHRLHRVDRTFDAHLIDHESDPAFARLWRDISVRAEPEVVLSMIGCHSFWRRGAFDAVAGLEPEVSVYLELFLPTAAHHLGFRVRAIGDQDAFIRPRPEFSDSEFDARRRDGARALHPLKAIWTARAATAH